MIVPWLRHIALIMLAVWVTCGYAAAQAPTPQWPRTITQDGASVTIYQPQAESWPDRKTLTARAAVAITPPNSKTQILGTVDVSMNTSTDSATGMVTLTDLQLVESHFPALDTQKASEVTNKLRAALPQMQTRQVPLNSILLSLKQVPVSAVAVNNDPPTIFYSSRPASLVVFDGDPVLAPVAKTGLSFAVNTNWDVFEDHGTWYLLNNGLWMSAPVATGPYSPVPRLPAAFNNLPNDASFADARKHIPARPPASAQAVPTIFASTKPAEIIVTDGPPKLEMVPGTTLQRVTNTGNALFFDPAQKQYYDLISGRWFAAANLEGPWSFASDKLPPDFSFIPTDSPAAAVLPSVPGTVQAQQAVLKAQIPTTATLKRDAAKLNVVYSGPPKFAPIPGTSIEYAVNTADQVLKVGEKYYACYQGAWFVSNAPNGPWMLAESVPQVIYSIPPSSPLYNVTYVQVYGVTPATVTYGYTAGYMMGFVTAGVLVYGTGYYYPPVVLHGPVPIYYPYPYSYAGSTWYNTATGAWARGGSIYGPYYGAAGGRYYNPTTGGWAQGGAVYGPYGGAGAWSAYNPHTGTYSHGSAVWGGGSGTANASFYNPRYGVSGSTNQNVNPYGRWGSSTVSGPNKTVNTASGSNARGSAGGFSSSTGAEGAGYHNRATGNSGGVVKGAGGDVYAGRDGNVYQHTDSGWSKWNDGSWNQVQPKSGSSGRLQGTQSGASQGGRRTSMDSSSYQQLEQDRFSRQAGEGRFGGGFEGGSGGGGRFRR
ncbi:MAG TPA: hypothetical protein VLI93_00755 [Acetobacteraceae bacterium]|nr:hypothetical protein [Acetobacteraceae bacterium]